LIFITNRKWTSSLLRGRQIAEALGVGCDPAVISSKETVVAVKCWHNDFPQFDHVYCDIVDSDSLLNILQASPHVGVITCTEKGRDYVSARIENEIRLIPHHHCNFENRTRSVKEPRVAGYVGSAGNLDLNPAEIQKALGKIGIDFLVLYNDGMSLSREDICRFYLSIDLQLVFRKPRLIPNMPPELKNPLKLVNAGSFGVPTVGYPEPCFGAANGGFVQAMNLNQIVEACAALKSDRSLYRRLAESGRQQAQAYHVFRIAPRYRDLEAPMDG
jgi:hypothetical protein